MKRTMDVVFSLTALLLLSPLLLLVALAVARDGGPALFVQRRVGLGGREFGMYKFRSMVPDASALGSYQTVSGDARITPVGRFIRRTSIDELPQLINVLRGQMSLVGPRPDVPAQRELYLPADWAVRCSVRPGLTGWAQALLRSEATAQQRLELDLRYAREHSLWLDLKIMAWTISRLSGKGSN
ncbi:MAG: sugar transferase [Burkholderiales bacterium]|nr:MAG: sugar transferase [Burkholderiales bacterium]